MNCCDFHAGMLTERVLLERSSTTSDGHGGTTTAWAADPATAVGAQMIPLTGTEATVAQRLAPTANFRCTIRFRSDAQGNPYYTPDNRLKHRGRTFNILYVSDRKMQHRWIEMLLVEGRPS
jgi:SPP1 family predicted phage head-tail adaptor